VVGSPFPGALAAHFGRTRPARGPGGWGTNLTRMDANYYLNAGLYNYLRFNFEFDRTPHTIANNAQTIYDEFSPGSSRFRPRAGGTRHRVERGVCHNPPTGNGMPYRRPSINLLRPMNWYSRRIPQVWAFKLAPPAGVGAGVAGYSLPPTGTSPGGLSSGRPEVRRGVGRPRTSESTRRRWRDTRAIVSSSFQLYVLSV